ncbi:MAG TPA: S-adenosylmethionine:tRNA ribosyltransferase-isomerase, partial [Bacteroidales bacterium]|nr:S-adenosylmethionine:tRNA ribosyltransferase-isomerase [Bacteroidales bacterium]
MKPKEINISDYDYYLPERRIAQTPATIRDRSKLLVFKNNIISEDSFSNVAEYIPERSLLVYNNSRVIKARLLFGKETGAKIEILCIEPINPPDYESSFKATGSVEWSCIVGNLKKWKQGRINYLFTSKG